MRRAPFYKIIVLRMLVVGNAKGCFGTREFGRDPTDISNHSKGGTSTLAIQTMQPGGDPMDVGATNYGAA